jgi:type IV pilus assembly protein PilC
MPTFHYEAMNAQGQEVKDVVEALSTEEAISKIRNQGFFPTKIKEKGGKKRDRNDGSSGIFASKGTKVKLPRGTGGGVPLKSLTQFTRQLSTLQDAGLPILRSLNILEEQQRPGTLKRVIAAVTEGVEGGSTLSESMGKFSKCFDNLYANMVAAGEAGGVLDVILQRLAEFMESSERLKSKLKAAMIYPVAVITIAFAIVMGIMTFIIPKFQEVFEDFDIELPWATQFLLDTSEWIKYSYGWLILMVVPVLCVGAAKLIRMSESGRYITDVVFLRIPVIGSLIGRSTIARFTRTLGTLIQAGVPIIDAIDITAKTTGNGVYRDALNKVKESIRKGEAFADPLRKARVCDSLVTNMIDVGEETGDLDKMLYKIADNYDEEVERSIEALVALLEPVMVIMLGGVCGFIVVALFMPMISIVSGI